MGRTPRGLASVRGPCLCLREAALQEDWWARQAPGLPKIQAPPQAKVEGSVTSEFNPQGLEWSQATGAAEGAPPGPCLR